MRKVTFALVVMAGAFMTLQSANASWQLIPGKPYDGHYPVSVLKEPCWSAATSKCAFEKYRRQYHNDSRKAPQR
jgi:hypothetical protein